MANDKLIPQYLNQDEDERLVKSVEMVDALNVRVSHEDDGDQGILKNVDGNTIVAARSAADTIPSTGTNRVIGSVASDASKCVYYFLYNSAGDHGIYRYNVTSDDYQKLYEDSVLNFEYDSFVKADVVINQYQEDLLYFTDNRNEPRKINATRAGLNQYADELESGTAYQKELYLTTCKRPPQTAVTFEFVDDETRDINNLKEDCFQFACQYVYDDGEVSALSIYSALAISPTHLAYNSTTRNIFQSENNALDLTVPNSDGPVEKIRVFARRNNRGAFYQIEELDNGANDTQTFRFYNDGVYRVLPNEESNKQYDAVPRRAATQVVSNNRLMFGNYIEGFDPTDTSSIQYPVYHPGGSEALNNFVGSAVTRDYDTSSGTYETDVVRFFGDVNAEFEDLDDTSSGWTDGSTWAGEIDPEYNDVMNPGSESITFDFALAQSQGTASTFSYDLTVSMGEIAFSSHGATANTDYRASNAFIERPIVIRNGEGTVIGTSSHTDGLQFFHPRVVDGTQIDKANKNSGFRNLRPQNNLNLSGQVSVDAWQSKQQLGDAIAAGLIGTKGVVIVAPNDEPDFSDTETPQDILKGHTTEARIIDADGSHPGFTNSDGDDESSKLFIWMEGSVEFEITSATYIASSEELRVSIRRSDFNLRSTRVVNISNPFGLEKLKPHPLVSAIATHGELHSPFVSGGGVFQSQWFPPSIGWINGDYYVREWNGNAFEVSISGEDQVDNGETYIGGGVATALDGNISGGGFVTTRLRDAKAARVSLNQNISLGQSRTFKSGAKHEFGIVYFDHRNRTSPVYKLGSVDVERFGFRNSGNNGRTEVDLRLLHEPPPYATHWAPVYTKNLTYESFLQVTVAEAALPRKTSFTNILSGDGSSAQSVVTGTKTSEAETIFLSMRPLEGKNNSYKELKGAQIDYKYQEGDKLRVIEYLNDGAVSRPYYEFTITGYNYFNDDENNPILLGRNSTGDDTTNADNYRRTGWFLSIRDDKVAGFTAADIATGADYFSERCLIEIVRPRKVSENNLYYEIGEQREVVTANGVRTHAGDRDNTSITDFSVTPIRGNAFFSTERLYVGDRVTQASLSSSGYVFVSGVIPQDVGYIYTVDPSNPVIVPQNPATLTGANVLSSSTSYNSLHPGVITLTEGDCHLRVREQLVSKISEYTVGNTTFTHDQADVEDQTYINFLIESESVSDFFDSEATDIGRPHVENPELTELTRSSSVTYSDPFVLDSSRMNLSSFNPSLFPFKDFSTQYGQVTDLRDAGESIHVLQEKRCAIQPVSRTLIQSAGEGQLVTSTDVLGTETYFAGLFGPGRNPESVSTRFGKTYFVDVEAGKVIELSSQGIKPISDEKMSSYFKTTFAAATNTQTRPRIPTGIDPDNDELVLTILQLLTNNITVDGNVIGIVPAATAGDLTYDDGITTPVFESVGITTWDKDQAKWETPTTSNEMNWNQKGMATVILDRLNHRDGVYIDKGDRASTGTVKADVVTSDRKFIGIADIDREDFSINIPSTMVEVADDTTPAVTVTQNASSSLNTLAYSTTKGFWLTRYSFTPEMYANVHNVFLSFNNGQVYTHNDNGTRNNFYGTQYNSQATVISRANPSSVKVYNSLGLEGNASWSAVVSNNEQTTDITAAMYEEREGMYYTVIPRDITASSTTNMSHKVVLGEVESISGNDVTFTTRVSNLPFGLGDSVFVLASDSETDTSNTVSSVKGRKVLTLSGVSGISVGNVLMAISTDEVNGDKLRDYHARIALTNTSTGPVELYAVNANYTVSPLHNDQTE